MLTSKKGDRNPKFHSKAVAARLIKSIARSGSVRTTKHAASRTVQLTYYNCNAVRLEK